MLLSLLLQNRVKLPKDLDREVSRLILDSRELQPKDLFFAIKGTQIDGRKYIAEAIAKKVAAILVEAETPHESIQTEQQILLIPIYQLRQQLGLIAAAFYSQPSQKLHMLGITGTSGKTSCSHFLAQSLESLNEPCGIIGTLGSGFYGALKNIGLTTPDAITLQATLNDFVQQGAKAVAMEVSSHSIDQGRINGIHFDLGIFTNLTQDHLDYHGDMATYAAVKRRFFTDFPMRYAVINADDTYGQKWLTEVAGTDTSLYAYSLNKKVSLPASVPLIFANHIETTSQGMKAEIDSPWGKEITVIPLVGKFNLSNALAVFTALCLQGVSFTKAINCLTQLKPVPGRMQSLGGEAKPLVVVDYAHKPDALEKVLQVLRAHTSGRLICVFGCGGERDQGKRPLMAQIAERFADEVIVTNDNPRHEKPETIIEQICAGFSNPKRFSIELDRSKAIQKSIQCASEKDCVLIAGKGAEQYQQIGDEKIPFDDVTHALTYLKLS